MADSPWDAGLQPERTLLAWVRTGLTLAVVSLLLTRLTTGSGVAALVTGSTGLIVAAVVVSVQSSRYKRNDARLREGTLRPALLAALAVTAWTVTMAGTAFVLMMTGAA